MIKKTGMKEHLLGPVQFLGEVSLSKHKERGIFEGICW
jgi:hypothetical protein